MESSLLSVGVPRCERGDAARNRRHLLDTAREMIGECGVEMVTMDGLAERAGLGKGTVFRRFGTRAGIFHALLDADETMFQHRVLSGPPPLGPGADPVARLAAYGRARIEFLLEHLAMVRAALDSNRTVPTGRAAMSLLHIRVLLDQARIGVPGTANLAVALTAALEGPLLFYLQLPVEDDGASVFPQLADTWQTLVERLCRPHSDATTCDDSG